MKYLAALVAALACAGILIWTAHIWAETVVAEPPAPPPPPALTTDEAPDPDQVRRALATQIRIAQRAAEGADDPVAAIAQALPGIEISERPGDAREGVLLLERLEDGSARICIRSAGLRECGRSRS